MIYESLFSYFSAELKDKQKKTGECVMISQNGSLQSMLSGFHTEGAC